MNDEFVDTTPDDGLEELIDEMEDDAFDSPDEAATEEEAEAHFLQVVEGGLQAEEAPEQELNWPTIAQQAAIQIMQTFQAGDTVEMIMIKTAYCEPFTTAFRTLPDEFFLQAGFSLDIRDQLPIVDDENCPGIQMVKGSMLESQFLQRYYGPVEQGGNGLLPKMIQALNQRNSHVKITVDWLRNRYLTEVAEDAAPRIEIPRGSQLLMAQATPTGRLR